MVTKKTTNNVTALFLIFSDAAECFGHVTVPASKTDDKRQGQRDTARPRQLRESCPRFDERHCLRRR